MNELARLIYWGVGIITSVQIVTAYLITNKVFYLILGGVSFLFTLIATRITKSDKEKK